MGAEDYKTYGDALYTTRLSLWLYWKKWY
jgi:hypothetical protein